MLAEVLKKNPPPPKPGCYLFRDAPGTILYVGKAKDLSRRVPSYARADVDAKTQQLVRKVASVEYLVMRDEVEALLVEARLVKQHQPKYNIDLKSGERYAYIQVTDEPFPRLVTSRTPKSGDRVFGPYTSGETRQQALHLANTIFKLRVCKKLPKRACLLYHLNLCSAPCIGKISVGQYAVSVRKAERLLKGEIDPLRETLKSEMKKHADQQEYEAAKLRRDQVRALDRLGGDQAAKLRRAYEVDVVNFVATPQRMVVQVFHVSKGVISQRREFTLRRTLGQTDAVLLSEFLTTYYYAEEIPSEVVLPLELEDQSAVAEYLSRTAGRSVELHVPKRGEKKRLLELLGQNLEVSQRAGDVALVELQEQLKLPTLPRVVECFDISNLGPKDLVASMVQFRNGRPDKNNYRRFRIRTVRGQSDVGSMREVVDRRYRRLLRERAALPDLVLIDGGQPQLSAALAAMRELGLTLPVAALAKKLEEIYTTDAMYPLRLSRTSAALKLLQRVRDEAHRFALKYQRLRRAKRFFNAR